MYVLGAVLTLTAAYAFGVLLFRNLPLPKLLIFGLGAAVESLAVYLLLLVGLGAAVLLPLAAIPCLVFLRPKPFSELSARPPKLFLGVFCVFGVYYLVHALAPEIQPDAITYHLGLTAEYLRLHAFPHRIGFYEVLPQGFEMLFVMAYSIGGESAAKLVHFAFLILSVPLIALIGVRLKLTAFQAYGAALLYFAAPVAGVSGTCAYNDAALVFFTLATFYLLLLWRNDRLIAYAFAAGLTAGFCYAIKLTGLIVLPLAFLFILSTGRRVRPALYLSLGAFVMIAPWMLRALVLTGNPLAPLFNAWFPNLYFNAVTERALAQALTNYPGFHWSAALWDWAIAGPAQGVTGPLILCAPVALLAWRKPAGRLLLATALLLLVPVCFNTGARFLMPALPFLALALALALPQTAFVALASLQTVVCFPPVIVQLQGPNPWALRGFPWRAALRLDSELTYLESTSSAYRVAKFVEGHTTDKDLIFSTDSIAKAFTSRQIVEYWHSNRALRFTAAMQHALLDPRAFRAQFEWPAQVLTGIRFVSTSDLSREWSVFDTRLHSPGGFIFNSPQWNLAANANLSDASGAFDGNRATFWTSRTPQRNGMYLAAEFDQPLLLDSVTLFLGGSAQPAFVVEGRPASNRSWQFLSGSFNSKTVDAQDLRRDSVRALQRSGFTAIGVSINGEGLSALASDMVAHPSRWGLTDLGSYGHFHLMRITAP